MTRIYSTAEKTCDAVTALVRRRDYDAGYMDAATKLPSLTDRTPDYWRGWLDARVPTKGGV